MEPLLWLLAPFVVTAVVAAVLILRSRRPEPDAQTRARRRQRELDRMAAVLGRSPR